jgi:hypothetical protein
MRGRARHSQGVPPQSGELPQARMVLPSCFALSALTAQVDSMGLFMMTHSLVPFSIGSSAVMSVRTGTMKEELPSCLMAYS